MYLLMVLLVISWGLEYIFAKQALEAFEPLTLICIRYSIGVFIVLIIKFKAEGKSPLQKRDIPLFLACAIFGEIGYFYCEYSAMDFLPVSLVTIVLAFVPALSILIDKALYKKAITSKMIGGILISIVGITLVIGVDFHILFQGRIKGYFFAFGAVVFWNLYNFLTSSLHDRYESATLTCNQLICTIILTIPYALRHLPSADLITPSMIGGLLYLGIIGTGFGFLVTVRGLHVLGPTISAIFSNFLPVTTTFFGWIILKETILPVQIVGGVMVIIAGYIVIKEKGRLEDLSHDRAE